MSGDRLGRAEDGEEEAPTCLELLGGIFYLASAVDLLLPLGCQLL